MDPDHYDVMGMSHVPKGTAIVLSKGVRGAGWRFLPSVTVPLLELEDYLGTRLQTDVFMILIHPTDVPALPGKVVDLTRGAEPPVTSH